ncbi:MAG: ABC transporter substrate-binding protein [Longimicrobiales bacterium]
MIERRRRSVLAAALAFGCVAACAEEPGEARDGALEPRYGGTLVVAGPSDLDHANSLVTAEAYTQQINRFALFLPLVRFAPDLSLEPALAESWELSGDTAVVFRLRRDVSWHDGVPTTAEDVAFTFTRAKDPATGFPNSDYFTAWNAVEVVDSFTVRFRFEPHFEPLAALPFLPIMPRHRLESVPPAEMRQAPFNKAPVGNGPFRFVEYRANDRWIFEANPAFPEELGGRPYVDRLVWRVVVDPTAQVTEIRTGQVDLVMTPRADDLAALEADPQVRTIVSPSRQYAFIGWNHRHEPLGDARVRRALSMAIDRQEIIDALRAGHGTLAAGPVPPHHWAHDEATEPLPFDTAAARGLLAEAGYSDRTGDRTLEDAAGRPLRLVLQFPAASDFNRDMAQMIQADLAAIGVQLEIRPTDFATLIQNISQPARSFEAVLMGWESDFRLNVRDLFHSDQAGTGPFALAGYRNAEVDALLEAAARARSRNEARSAWRRFQRILRDEQPWTFLYYYPEFTAVRDRVHGVEVDLRGRLIRLPQWWIQDGAVTAAAPDSSPAVGR